MDLREIGSPGFGQTAQLPNDRTLRNRRVSVISGMSLFVLSCSVCGEWSIESGEPIRLGRTSYLVAGRTSLLFPPHA